MQWIALNIRAVFRRAARPIGIGQRRLTDESSGRTVSYRRDTSRVTRCSWKFINGKLNASSILAQTMGKRAGTVEVAFLARDPGRNGWSMQSGIAEGKGSRGWKGGLVMTRAISLLISLSLCAKVEAFHHRVAQRRTLSSDILRYIPPAEAEEK